MFWKESAIVTEVYYGWKIFWKMEEEGAHVKTLQDMEWPQIY